MSETIVIVPAYNEETKITKVIQNIHEAVPDFDILVIDDASKDRTAALALSMGVNVISHPFNMGYGVAIQTGYKYAFAKGYEYLVQLDGDGQHDPKFIPSLLSPVVDNRVDFVLGSRFLGEGNYKSSTIRMIGMIFFRNIVSMIIGTKITDSTSGFQAFNKKVIKFFTSDVFPSDYPDADVLIALHKAQFKLCEIPVQMFPNTEGKSMHSGFKPLYYIFKMLLSIFVTLLRK